MAFPVSCARRARKLDEVANTRIAGGPATCDAARCYHQPTWHCTWSSWALFSPHLTVRSCPPRRSLALSSQQALGLANKVLAKGNEAHVFNDWASAMEMQMLTEASSRPGAHLSIVHVPACVIVQVVHSIRVVGSSRSLPATLLLCLGPNPPSFPTLARACPTCL